MTPEQKEQLAEMLADGLGYARGEMHVTLEAMMAYCREHSLDFDFELHNNLWGKWLFICRIKSRFTSTDPIEAFGLALLAAKEATK